MAIKAKRRRPKDSLELGMYQAQRRFAKKRAFYRRQEAKGIPIPESRRRKYLPEEDYEVSNNPKDLLK